MLIQEESIFEAMTHRRRKSHCLRVRRSILMLGVCPTRVRSYHAHAKTSQTSSDPAFLSIESRVYSRRKRTVVAMTKNGAVIANASMLRDSICLIQCHGLGQTVGHRIDMYKRSQTKHSTKCRSSPKPK